jgi:hypothetical protein
MLRVTGRISWNDIVCYQRFNSLSRRMGGTTTPGGDLAEFSASDY